MKTSGVICSMPKEKFGYFGWPSIARQDDGTLIVAASGFRNQHVCPWGRTVVCKSHDRRQSSSTTRRWTTATRALSLLVANVLR